MPELGSHILCLACVGWLVWRLFLYRCVNLPGQGDLIDVRMPAAAVNRGKRGFTYTHRPALDSPEKSEAIKEANQEGFPINLSADSTKEADELVALSIGPLRQSYPRIRGKLSRLLAVTGSSSARMYSAFGQSD